MSGSFKKFKSNYAKISYVKIFKAINKLMSFNNNKSNINKLLDELNGEKSTKT